MTKKIILGLVVLGLIIAGIVLFGGSSKSGKATIEQKVAESRENRAEKAKADGYPQAWQDAGLPQYSDAELTKTRVLGKRVMISLESNKSIQEVTDYYKKEMKSLGFKSDREISNPMISILSYGRGSEIVAVQVTSMKGADAVQIQLTYQD